MEHLYIIAGCNGAGKTTASNTILPKTLLVKEFVNADEIARGLSPFNPGNVGIEAGRLMIKRIGELLDANETFSVETTLSSRTYLNLIRRAHAKGYMVHLLYFWLNGVELAKQRVAERVLSGGHGIEPDVIERRYYAGLKNLFTIFMKEVDVWAIYDNSYNEIERVAFGGSKVPLQVSNAVKYDIIKNYDKKRN